MSVGIDEKGEMYVDGVSETALYIADNGRNELGLTVESLIKYVNIYDVLLLTDYVKRNKIFTINDLQNLSDQIKTGKTLSLKETISSIDSFRINKLINIYDFSSLTDFIGNINKNLIVSDLINLNEYIDAKRISNILTIFDSIDLTEELYLNKQMVISETIYLNDILFLNKIFNLTDTLSLNDVIKIHKAFFITDTSSLEDIIEVNKNLKDMIVYIDEKGEMYVDGVSETGLYIADDGCNELGLTVEFLIKYVNVYDVLLLTDLIKIDKNLFIFDLINIYDIILKKYNGTVRDAILLTDIIGYISLWDKTYLYGNINDIVYLEGNINRNT